MGEEIYALEKNEIRFLNKLLEDKTAIGSKLIHNIKTDEARKISRYKACLVVQSHKI